MSSMGHVVQARSIRYIISLFAFGEVCNAIGIRIRLPCVNVFSASQSTRDGGRKARSVARALQVAIVQHARYGGFTISWWCRDSRSYEKMRFEAFCFVEARSSLS